MAERDEFYVGYLPQGPEGIRRRSRRGVQVVFLIGVALAVTLALTQGAFDTGSFEFGMNKTFSGIVIEEPYPLLITEEDGRVRSHLLVDVGKHGADSVAGMDGRYVRFEGQRIYNDERQMIEVQPGVAALDEAAPAVLRAWVDQPEQDLGTMSFVGEIVDSKCHLGTMKPGRQKPHKACAIRCIAGGIPPVLRVEARDGTLTYLLLVSAEGRAVNDDVLDMVAEPVEISGRVVRRGDQFILHADPSSYRRLPS